MAHQYDFSFDMTTLLQPNTSSVLKRVGHIVFIYFNFSSVHFWFLVPQHISKYITVLINKFIFKVSFVLNVVLQLIFMKHYVCGHTQTAKRIPWWEGKLAAFINSLQTFFSTLLFANAIHMPKRFSSSLDICYST